MYICIHTYIVYFDRDDRRFDKRLRVSMTGLVFISTMTRLDSLTRAKPHGYGFKSCNVYGSHQIWSCDIFRSHLEVADRYQTTGKRYNEKSFFPKKNRLIYYTQKYHMASKWRYLIN